MDAEETAALMLQCVARGHMRRKQVEMNRGALEYRRVRLRDSMRAHLRRAIFGFRRPGDEWHPAATTIASIARARTGKLAFQAARVAATLIAAHGRMAPVRKLFLRKRSSAVLIQDEWRLHQEQLKGGRVRRNDTKLALALVGVAVRALRERDENTLHKIVAPGFEYSLDLDHGMGVHTVGLAAYLDNQFLARQVPLLQRKGKVFKPMKALTSTSVTTELSMGVADVHVEYTIHHPHAEGRGPLVTRVRVTPRHPFGGPGVPRGSMSNLNLHVSSARSLRVASPDSRASPATSAARSPSADDLLDELPASPFGTPRSAGEKLWPAEHRPSAEELLRTSSGSPIVHPGHELHAEMAKVSVALAAPEQELRDTVMARGWQSLRACQVRDEYEARCAGGGERARDYE